MLGCRPDFVNPIGPDRALQAACIIILSMSAKAEVDEMQAGYISLKAGFEFREFGNQRGLVEGAATAVGYLKQGESSCSKKRKFECVPQ